MKPLMQPGRGAASPRPAAPRAGGLSMAFSGGDGGGSGKKRALASLNPSAPADVLAGAFGSADGSAPQQKQQPQGQQQQQQQQNQQHQKQQPHQQHGKLPAGGLTTQFGSGQFSVGSCDGFQHPDAFAGGHSFAPSPLSPLSEVARQGPAGSAQHSPLSEALAIGSHPRYKVPRRQPASAANSATAASLTAAAAAEFEDAVEGDEAAEDSATGWAISGTPPHVMTAAAAAAAMSMPYGPASPAFGDFRPGSVYEGAGRKLRGTEAMRMRNAVLRQTGFLEPQNCDNMFSDHTAGGTPPQHYQLATSVS